MKLGLEDGFNELQGTVWAVGKIQVEKAKLKDCLLQAQARAALEGLLPIVSAKWAAIDRNFTELDGYWYDLAMQLLMLMFYICTLRIWHPLE